MARLRVTTRGNARQINKAKDEGNVMKVFWRSLAAIAILAGLASPAVAEMRYKVQDIGTLPGDYASTPWGINSHGDVVGSSTGPGGQRAFVFFDRAGMIELRGISRRAFSVARDINDFGQVVGQSNFRATLWDLSRTARTNFGTPRYLDSQGRDSLDRSSDALAINNAGDVVGWFGGNQLSAPRHAFVYTAERGMVNITPFKPGIAHDINDAGLVAGWQDGRAFLWDHGEIRALRVVSEFKLASAYGINTFSEVVGSMTDIGLTTQHAFRYSASNGLEDLGGRGDQNLLRRINASGQSVGQGRLENGKLQALIHTDEHGLEALNDLITSPDAWYIEDATDINDKGMIVALAWHSDSRTRRAVRLVPVEISEGKCVSKCIRSNGIALTPLLRRNYPWVEATILVQDENGKPLPGVEVTITWSLPDGTTVTQHGQSGKANENELAMGGQRGTYVLKVRKLARDGYTFDPVASKAMVASVKL